MPHPRNGPNARQASASYAAPALTKGLEILELLAGAEAPLATKAIADQLGRSKNEIFRMIHVLVAQGYVARADGTDNLILTNRLFDLGMRSPRARSLTEVAGPVMERLCDFTGQSAHLVVLVRGETVILATASGRADISVTLALGYRRSALDSTSGALLIAFQTPEQRRRLIAEALAATPARTETVQPDTVFDAVRASGHLVQPSRDAVGVTDIAAPVLRADGVAIAALVVPYLNRHGAAPRYDRLAAAVRTACSEIAQALGEARQPG